MAKAATKPAPEAAPVIPRDHPAPPAPVRDLVRVCGTCDFWAAFGNGPGGYVSVGAEGPSGMCRRNPPAAPMIYGAIEAIGPFKVSRAVWPMTFIGENCGEWRGRVDA